MATKFYGRMVGLAKGESSYGVDPTLAGATDAFLAKNLNWSLETEELSRDVVLPYFGDLPDVVSCGWTKFSYDLEMAGSGTVAVAPAWGRHLLPCAFSETITPVTGPVVYTPVSSAFGSIAHEWYLDGLKHQCLGGRGNVSFKIQARQAPMFSFEFTSLYVAVADVANPSPTLTAWKEPESTNKANTTFSMFGYTAVLESINLSMGHGVHYENRPNEECVNIIPHEGKVKGTVAIRADTVAAKDWWAIARAGTTGVVQVVQGSAANKKAQVDLAKAQIFRPRYRNANGIALIEFDLKASTSAGNDTAIFTAL